MKFEEIIKSKNDNTEKFVFTTDDNLVLEFSYINKNDGKDIICMPTQTMCNLACKFCHTTDYIGKIKNRNVKEREMITGVKEVIRIKELVNNKRTLLISFMGCGEPIYNVENVVEFMFNIKKFLEEKVGIPYVRFSMATSLPKHRWESFLN